MGTRRSRGGRSAPPPRARATTFVAGDERFVVLSYPLADLPGVDDLSPAELEVVKAILGGMSNAEIARRRGRAVRTVANQVAAIFRKLGVGSRSELAAAFVRGLAPRHGNDG